jgi:hypothetical protein
VSFAAITLCVTSQRVFISLSTQSGNFWIRLRTLNKQLRSADKGWFSSLGGGGLDKGPTTPQLKKKRACYEMLHRTSEVDGFLLTSYIKGREFLD